MLLTWPQLRKRCPQVFYDVLSGDPLTPRWQEIIVKVGTYGSVQDVKDLRDTLK